MPTRANVDAPVSLLGAPRSGTTLVAELFRKHPDFEETPVGETANLVFGMWRSIDLARGVTRPTQRGERILTADERAALGVRDAMLSLFPDRSRRWVHKPIGLPKAVSEQYGDDEWDDGADWYWNVWRHTFPNSATAVILRDPWDVVASQRARFGFSEDSLWWSYAYLTHILSRGESQIRHVLRYEALLADRGKETRRLFADLGIPFDSAVMQAFDVRHVPNDRPSQRFELTGPSAEQETIISSGFERLGQTLEWPRLAVPTAAEEAERPRELVQLQQEIERLERRAERRELDAADERFRLHQEIARWRRIVNSNRHELGIAGDVADELDRQLDHGEQAQARAAQRESYVRTLEDELDRIYRSRTWRAATHFFHARNRYRHDGRRVGVQAFLTPPTVRERVKDLRDHARPIVSPAAAIQPEKERAISLVLPSGITLGGVTSWAIAIATEISVGRRSVVIQHPDTGPPIATEVSGRVEVFPATSPAVPRPRGVKRLAHEYAPALPAVVVPNYNYAGYAMMAELSREHAEHTRVVGIAHTDQLHYYSLLSFYEPIIHSFVAVSDEIATKLRRVIPPERDGDIVVMPYGVQIPNLKTRTIRADDEPLRLVYAGRLEAEQKRVIRLVELAARLHRADVNFTLNIVGDGDEEEALRKAIERLPSPVSDRVTMRSAVRPDEMSDLWQHHDVCILVSAYEGTSIAMLEAMANGCVPVVTSVSGTRAVISDANVGVTCDRDDLDHMVRELKGLDQNRQRLRDMAANGRRKVSEEYSFEDHAHDFEDLCLATWAADPRQWPDDRLVVPEDRLLFEAGIDRRVNG